MVLRELVFVGIAGCVAACGGGSPAGPSSTGDPCGDDGGTVAPGASCVTSVRGTVVDAEHTPLGALAVSVCGNVCWYGESDATGAFAVQVGARIVPDQFSTLVHGRPTRTTFYWQLPSTATGKVDVGQLLALDLPADGAPLVVKTDKQGAPAQTVTHGDVTLDVPAGVSVKLDVEDVALGTQGKLFRALAVPAELRDRFADPSLGLVSLHALTPFEAALVKGTGGDSTTARLSITNVAGLSAGTAVEFLALGSYLFPEWVKPAAFEPVSTGTVSNDGSTVDMDPGQGVSHLTWVGVRKKP